jgi:Bacterial extracellular solute-binding proteins, family 3
MAPFRSSISPWRRLLWWFLLPCASTGAKVDQFPSEIRLKAGVLHAPPMAMVEELQSGETKFKGLQIDFLNRLIIFAAQDGVTLQVDLQPSPSQYAEAFNLIASDCNTTNNPNPKEACDQFDILLGDFYSNSERYWRADLTPPWWKSSMTTLKYVEKAEGVEDYTTLSEAEAAGAAVCVPQQTYLAQVVQQKFPGNKYIECDPSSTNCEDILKNGTCVLYANDELLLHYRNVHDPTVKITREYFNQQYLVWPMREDLNSTTSKLINKWIYRAIENATMEELYYQYFSNDLCPIGTAGERCELPCDPGKS